MVYKTPFLKQNVTRDFDPTADGDYNEELTNHPLLAVWLTVKGDLVQADVCINNILASITDIELSHGGFTVVKYADAIKCAVMNMKLKGGWGYLVASSQTIDDVVGYTFPILLGAPYLNPKMCLPSNKDNPNRLTFHYDDASAYVDDLIIDVHEVLMPDAQPLGAIKQEQIDYAASGTGDVDKKLQTNWDLLKLLLYSTTVPDDTAYTATIERAGLELDDFWFGYKYCQWEVLHGELMDELTGQTGIENHIHADPSSGNTGMPVNLESWISHYGQMDFFYEYNLDWKAPLSESKTAKLKLNLGVDEAFSIATASYVPVRKLEQK